MSVLGTTWELGFLSPILQMRKLRSQASKKGTRTLSKLALDSSASSPLPYILPL